MKNIWGADNQKLKAVTNGNTQAFLLDSFNMEIVQLCHFLECSLCNTFCIMRLQTFPGNISLSHICPYLLDDTHLSPSLGNKLEDSHHLHEL